ncbi:MAG: pseudouridine synthase [Bdellovibrionia bacterium]
MLPILYRDRDLLVMNKPCGLLVHPSPVDRYATEFAVTYARAAAGGDVFPVHRLDRATSGALIFALSREAARAVAAQFEERLVKKKYLAIVRGAPPEHVTIDYALSELAELKGTKLHDRPAQQAVTEIRRLATHEFQVAVDKFPTSIYSLVEASPLTGRRHQIRRHLRHINCPIIGDVRHGKGKHNRFFESEFGVRRLLLACVELEFAHPSTGALIAVRAPLEENFAAILKRLEWPTS